MTHNVFFIGDTHFTHKKILLFEPEKRKFDSVEEHDEALIERWNSVVTKNDTVWHLGDVLFSGHSFHLLDRLNGKKKLVLGNHDAAFPVTRFAEYFGTIVASTKFDGSILSHIPIHPDQFYRWKANIHGHLHSKVVETTARLPVDDGESGETDWYTVPDTRYVNVSAEQINLTPISYEDLKTKHPILTKEIKRREDAKENA